MSKILNVTHLRKSYTSGSKELVVLDDITFGIEEGATFAIVGPSGSGKTTLLGLCAGLDRADTGEVELCGVSLSELNEDERALLRNREIGFIFQDFQLIPTLTALETVSRSDKSTIRSRRPAESGTRTAAGRSPNRRRIRGTTDLRTRTIHIERIGRGTASM